MLAGLPREYDTVVSVIDATDGEPDLDDILPKLLRAEQRFGKAYNPGETAAFSAMYGRGGSTSSSSRSNFVSRGGLAGGRGRFGGGRGAPLGGRGWRSTSNADAAGPRGRGPSGGESRICFHCGERGHIRDNCPKRNESSAGDHSSRAMVLAASDNTLLPADKWAIDSGAAYHITPYQELLSDYKPLNTPITITFGNGEACSAVGKGNAFVGGTKGNVQLASVLHVPGAKFNHFSSLTAASRGATAVMEGGRSYVMHGGRVVLEGERHSCGLFVLSARRPSAGGGGLALSAASETAELWHRRFGHLGYDGLSLLVKGNMVTGINASANAFEAAKVKVCEPCVLAKQHRLPFPEGRGPKRGALDLVHMDVCVMPEPSLGGSRYVATFLDDATKLSYVACIAHKSDVASLVKQTLAALERQADRPVRAVRTDRGSEYLNRELGAWFKDKGIVHETTAPYTPEQNGAAERLNRTLMERVRAMLFEAGLPRELWAEAIVTANYIRNRSPTSIAVSTPWELFFGSKPVVSAMRVFGSRAYAHVPKELRNKLDPVSRKGVFVGYEPGAKAWRVLLDGERSGRGEPRRDVR